MSEVIDVKLGMAGEDGPADGAVREPLPGLGIDFGGTGIKAALIDLTSGELLTRRVRVNTPQPSTPAAVATSVAELVERVKSDRPIPLDVPVGIGLPAVIKGGVAMTAANIDKGWVGASADEIIGAALGRRVYAMNDADAAGLAEVRLGAGRDCHGTVLLLTVGTGIGSGLFVNGRLVPDTELGHIEINGRDAERRISGAARERRKLRWKAWALEFNEYVARLEAYLWPDLIILGGGVSKVIDRYREFLKSRAPIVPAEYKNTSGIIGAALNAADRVRAGDEGSPADTPDVAQPDVAQPAELAQHTRPAGARPSSG